jgi:hypothetical protein
VGVNVNDPFSETGPAAEPTIWVSGAIVTLLNKVIFPPLWIGALGGLLGWVFLTTGRISIASGFRPLAAFVVAATVFLLWFTARLQRVGYSGRELVIANYWREARIPFEQVESVEPVWWYRRRLVRVRFRTRTPFGQVVYYLPKWGPLRLLLTPPDEELRGIIS